jgi:hypothetical protein
MCGYVACVSECVVTWPVCRDNVWLRDLFVGDTPAHRSRNHTLYDIPPIRSVFQVTQTGARSSLMMADYCRNV